MSKKKIKATNYENLLNLRDGCSSSGNRLALLSSMIVSFSHTSTPLGISRSDFEAEFAKLIVEQLDCLSDYLKALGSNSSIT